MTWKNLNSIYLPTSGGTISGDLAISGNLTINDKTGKGTLYNVASELTSLKSSVTALTSSTGWVNLYQDGQENVKYYSSRGLTLLCWYFIQETTASWCAGQLPAEFRPEFDVIVPSCVIYNLKPTNDIGYCEILSSGYVNFINPNAGSKKYLRGSAIIRQTNGYIA